MPQFDVHRNRGQRSGVIPYVVVVQSRRFDRSLRRLVIPLVLRSAGPEPDPQLNPEVEIEGVRVVLHPLQLTSVALERLGPVVGSLREHGDRVLAAIDLVISRAWD